MHHAQITPTLGGYSLNFSWLGARTRQTPGRAAQSSEGPSTSCGGHGQCLAAGTTAACWPHRRSRSLSICGYLTFCARLGAARMRRRSTYHLDPETTTGQEGRATQTASTGGRIFESRERGGSLRTSFVHRSASLGSQRISTKIRGFCTYVAIGHVFAHTRSG